MSDFATELRGFNAAFDRYRQFNRRSVGALIEQRGRRLRFALWREFRAMAKTAAALREELAGRGWEIHRRPDPELSAAFPGAAAVGAVPRVSIEKEIKLRVRSLKFLSVSFLYQNWRSRGGGQDGRFAARSRTQARLGEAIVHTTESNENPLVALTSFLHGVVKQDERRGVATKVLRAETADMAAYLARKHQEELSRQFQRVYEGTLSVA